MMASGSQRGLSLVVAWDNSLPNDGEWLTESLVVVWANSVLNDGEWLTERTEFGGCLGQQSSQ